MQRICMLLKLNSSCMLVAITNTLNVFHKVCAKLRLQAYNCAFATHAKLHDCLLSSSKDAPPVNLLILFDACATEHATRSNYQSAAATAAAHQVLPCRCREHSRTVQPADAAALTGQACDLAQARGIDANRRTANLPCKYNGAMPLKKKRPN
jgi:hypothetical protein